MSKHRDAGNLAADNRRIKEIRRDLRTITVLYEAALNGPRQADQSGVRSPMASSEPVAVAVLDARGETYADLHFWCRFILDEINEGTLTTIVRPEIPDMAAFIERWTTAVVDQYPADATNLRADMGKHARRIEALAQGWTTKRIEIGKCPERTIELLANNVERERQCDGNLWATMQSAATMLPGTIVCDAQGDHAWTPHQWVALGRRIAS